MTSNNPLDPQVARVGSGLFRLLSKAAASLVKRATTNIRVRRANALFGLSDHELQKRGLARGDLADKLYAENYGY